MGELENKIGFKIRACFCAQRNAYTLSTCAAATILEERRWPAAVWWPTHWHPRSK